MNDSYAPLSDRSDQPGTCGSGATRLELELCVDAAADPTDVADLLWSVCRCAAATLPASVRIELFSECGICLVDDPIALAEHFGLALARTAEIAPPGNRAITVRVGAERVSIETRPCGPSLHGYPSRSIAEPRAEPGSPGIGSRD